MPATAPAPAAPPPAAKPSAPAPAPAPAASPRPSAPDLSQQPSEGASPAGMYTDAFADLDALDGGKKPPQRSPQTPREKIAAESEESATDGSLETESATAEGAEKPQKPAESGEQPKPAEQPQKPVKAKELREAYEGLKGKVKAEYEPRIRELEAKVQEYEELHRTINPKALQERAQAIEKRNQELEQHIRFVDYQKSGEYQEKYWQPYVKAWTDAVSELKGLTMEVEDKATGESVRREVTEADLQYFASLDPAARRTEINRLFPEDKEEVKRHINEVRRLYDASQQALDKAKKDADEHGKIQQEQAAAATQYRAKLWQDANKSLSEKYPHFFAPAENDTEGNQLFDRGRALADLVFAPESLTPEALELLPKAFKETIMARKPFTQEQQVMLYSIVRNKAINHDRMAAKLTAANKRITELETNLKAFEKSSPDNVAPGGGTKPAGNGSAGYEEELDAIDRKYQRL